jgi:gentisate 1,2-dioxygenase
VNLRPGPEFGDVGSLEELYEKLAPLAIGAGWNKPTPSLWPEPRKTFVPMHWSYGAAKPALDAAGRLIDTALAERRNLILANPVEGNTYGTSRTLVAAYQMVLGGERARSHRHSPNALRLIVDAQPGTFTIVDGARVPMAPGDVVLTPAWSWHGHANESDAPAYWIDFLDAPLVQLLEPMFFEQHPEGFEKADETLERSPMMYRWVDVEPALAKAPADPRYGRRLNLDMGARLSTIDLAMLGLDAGATTTVRRTTANLIYAVVSGVGTSEIDGSRFTWGPGDVFVAPAWRAHNHRADGGAVLLRVSDEPVQAKLGLLREE